MRTQVDITDELQDYVNVMSLREPPALAELRRETDEMPERLMQVSPEEGQFLTVLIRALGVRRAVEVGVFTGYSLVATALGLAAGGTVIGCEVDEEWAATALKYCERAGVADRVEMRIGDARDTLAALSREQPGTFDLVFIDADKEGYWDYFQHAVSLVRQGGLILVDNVLWHGAVLDADAPDSETVAVRDFNARVRDDSRVDISMVPFADGITFAVKR